MGDDGEIELFRVAERTIRENDTQMSKLFFNKNVDFTVTNSRGEDLLMKVCRINIPCEASFRILFFYEMRMIYAHPYDMDSYQNYEYTNRRDNNGITVFMTFLCSKLRAGSRSNRMWSYFRDSNPNLCDPTGRNCLWYAWFHYYKLNNSVPSNPIKIVEKVLFLFRCEEEDMTFVIDINHENIYGESFLHEVVVGFRDPLATNAASGERWYPDELKAWRYRLVKQLISWGATVTQAIIDQSQIGSNCDARVRQVLMANF